MWDREGGEGTESKTKSCIGHRCGTQSEKKALPHCTINQGKDSRQIHARSHAHAHVNQRRHADAETGTRTRSAATGTAGGCARKEGGHTRTHTGTGTGAELKRQQYEASRGHAKIVQGTRL